MAISQAEIAVLLTAQNLMKRELAEVEQGLARVERTAATTGDRGSQSMGRLGSSFGSFSKMVGAFSLGAGLIALPGILQAGARGAADDAAAFQRMEQAAANVGDGTAAMNDQLQQAIEHAQDLAFEDGQAAKAMSMLVTLTGDADVAMERWALTMDIARGAGIDLEAAAKLVGKASEENVASFRRMGIILPETATHMDYLAEAQRRFKDQGSLFAESDAGQLEQMNLQLKEAQESLGQALVPLMVAITPLVKAFADAIAKVTSNETGMKALTYLIGAVAAAWVAMRVGGMISSMAALATQTWAWARALQAASATRVLAGGAGGLGGLGGVALPGAAAGAGLAGATVVMLVTPRDTGQLFTGGEREFIENLFRANPDANIAGAPILGNAGLGAGAAGLVGNAPSLGGGGAGGQSPTAGMFGGIAAGGAGLAMAMGALRDAIPNLEKAAGLFKDLISGMSGTADAANSTKIALAELELQRLVDAGASEEQIQAQRDLIAGYENEQRVIDLNREAMTAWENELRLTRTTMLGGEEDASRMALAMGTIANQTGDATGAIALANELMRTGGANADEMAQDLAGVATELGAVEVMADGAGGAILTMPDGKKVTLSATDLASATVDGVNLKTSTMPDGTVFIYADDSAYRAKLREILNQYLQVAVNVFGIFGGGGGGGGTSYDYTGAGGYELRSSGTFINKLEVSAPNYLGGEDALVYHVDRALQRAGVSTGLGR